MPLSEVLSLVSCAETYGHTNDVIMGAFARWLGFKCSDEEIDAYADWFATPEAAKQGYGEEDRSAIRERLIAWRDRHCKSDRSSLEF